MPGSVTPIVLAAGASTRARQFKPLLPFEGETCLSLVLGACHGGGAWPPVVVLGREADAVRTHLPAEAIHCVNADFRSSGPARSLQIGLENLPPEAAAILVFPVDFPLVTAGDVVALVERWDDARRRGMRIVAPSHAMRRGHPVIVDLALAPELRALEPDEPIHHVIRAHAAEIEHVVRPDPWVLMDMDTHEDYERCLAAFRSRSR
jgi:CTP:molybdopterin cytidylyltransferase MocA